MLGPQRPCLSGAGGHPPFDVLACRLLSGMPPLGGGQFLTRRARVLGGGQIGPLVPFERGQPVGQHLRRLRAGRRVGGGVCLAQPGQGRQRAVPVVRGRTVLLLGRPLLVRRDGVRAGGRGTRVGGGAAHGARLAFPQGGGEFGGHAAQPPFLQIQPVLVRGARVFPGAQRLLGRLLDPVVQVLAAPGGGQPAAGLHHGLRTVSGPGPGRFRRAQPRREAIPFRCEPLQRRDGAGQQRGVLGVGPLQRGALGGQPGGPLLGLPRRAQRAEPTAYRPFLLGQRGGGRPGERGGKPRPGEPGRRDSVPVFLRRAFAEPQRGGDALRGARVGQFALGTFAFLPLRLPDGGAGAGFGPAFGAAYPVHRLGDLPLRPGVRGLGRPQGLGGDVAPLAGEAAQLRGPGQQVLLRLPGSGRLPQPVGQ